MRTSSSTPPLADLVGRARDLEAILAVVPTARSGGGSLLVVGDPGIGKSTLLDVVAEEAAGAGTRVLRASGAEFEAEVAFAALHQLLLPLHERFGALDAVHQQALDAIVSPSSGAGPDRLAICAATLALLDALADERPVLVVVDDVGWLDRPSATVLGFVARRIAGTPTGLLAACRTDARSFFERGDIPELDVGPLDERSSGHLVARRYPGMAPWVRRRILGEARGNPLALLELSATLTDSQRTARLALPETLPLSRRLQDLFEDRIRALPVPTRDLLLLAALDGTGDLRVVSADARLDDLGPAERARLVHVDEDARAVTF
ncbi:MAG TPA: ATP-binding protein, partial [Aquihabitans sp.]|nr:ATP-binding protein [Aquihabitans sp.]